MSETLRQILDLIARGEARVSAHDYDELTEGHILVRDVMKGVSEAVLVEDYPDYHKGPCVLVLQRDQGGDPIHVVWGIPQGASSPAVLVTAYRPDPERWSNDLTRREP